MFTHEQEKLIEKDMKKKSNADIETFKRLLIYITAAFLIYAPQIWCNQPHHTSAFRWFPDTWTCSGCGYSNYDGIHKCGVCGKSRN